MNNDAFISRVVHLPLPPLVPKKKNKKRPRWRIRSGFLFFTVAVGFRFVGEQTSFDKFILFAFGGSSHSSIWLPESFASSASFRLLFVFGCVVLFLFSSFASPRSRSVSFPFLLFERSRVSAVFDVRLFNSLLFRSPPPPPVLRARRCNRDKLSRERIPLGTKTRRSCSSQSSKLHSACQFSF